MSPTRPVTGPQRQVINNLIHTLQKLECCNNSVAVHRSCGSWIKQHSTKSTPSSDNVDGISGISPIPTLNMIWKLLSNWLHGRCWKEIKKLWFKRNRKKNPKVYLSWCHFNDTAPNWPNISCSTMSFCIIFCKDFRCHIALSTDISLKFTRHCSLILDFYCRTEICVMKNKVIKWPLKMNTKKLVLVNFHQFIYLQVLGNCLHSLRIYWRI